MGSEVPLHEQSGELKQGPDFIRSFVEAGLLLLSDYGWLILFIVICLLVLWTNLEPKFRRWVIKRDEARISAQMHRDPDSVMQQHEAMMSCRQRLQEEHDRNSEIHREKMQEKEEKKRQEKIEIYEKMMAGKSSLRTENPTNDKSNGAKNSRLHQNNFNALTGGSSSNSYRPSRRGRGG